MPATWLRTRTRKICRNASAERNRATSIPGMRNGFREPPRRAGEEQENERRGPVECASHYFPHGSGLGLAVQSLHAFLSLPAGIASNRDLFCASRNKARLKYHHQPRRPRERWRERDGGHCRTNGRKIMATNNQAIGIGCSTPRLRISHAHSLAQDLCSAARIDSSQSLALQFFPSPLLPRRPCALLHLFARHLCDSLTGSECTRTRDKQASNDAVRPPLAVSRLCPFLLLLFCALCARTIETFFSLLVFRVFFRLFEPVSRAPLGVQRSAKYASHSSVSLSPACCGRR